MQKSHCHKFSVGVATMDPITGAIGLAVVWVGGNAIGIGKRIYEKVQQNKREKEAEDTWKPIFTSNRKRPKKKPGHYLYLRPFKSKARMPIGLTDFHIEPAPGTEKDLETLLRETLSDYGNLVGLGKQGEMVGASRLHGGNKESEWQDKVEKMAYAAEIIFLIPSTNKGTFWEMEMIKNRRLLHKTVFILYSHFQWKQSVEAMNKLKLCIPEGVLKEGKSSFPFRARVLLVRFDRNGKYVWSTSGKAVNIKDDILYARMLLTN